MLHPPPAIPPTPAATAGWRPWAWILGLAALFLCLETLVPLASAIRLGADEDFELSKTLSFH
jgi:hypothetical protein